MPGVVDEHTAVLMAAEVRGKTRTADVQILIHLAARGLIGQHIALTGTL